jgi:hypothetical protein
MLGGLRRQVNETVETVVIGITIRRGGWMGSERMVGNSETGVRLLLTKSRDQAHGSCRSSTSTSTIAAARALRTVSAVVAIRAYLGGEDAGRESSREPQRGFEGAAFRFSHEPGVRRRGLGTRTVNCFRGDARALGCTDPGRCGWQRRGRTGLSQALPLAVFSHPCCSACWIAIRHISYTHGWTRAPCTRFTFSCSVGRSLALKKLITFWWPPRIE